MTQRMNIATIVLKALRLLLLSIWLFTAHAFSYQTTITDADRKEMLAVLFKDELSAAQNGKELTITVSPRTDSSWLLELPGIRFKKLKYEEENQTPEYYELRHSKLGPDYVEIWLGKGSYCVKNGPNYQFRKQNGKWNAKVDTYSESFSASGSSCPSCQPGLNSVYQSKLQRTIPGSVMEAPTSIALLLTGKTFATRCKRSEEKDIRCEVDLSLDFTNQGKQPAIILQPYGEYEFWHGASSLGLTKADFTYRNYAFTSAAWPSIYDTDEYRRLADALDQAMPPPNLTRVIAPGESWNWKTTIHIRFADENTCNALNGVRIGWKEIEKLSAPVWLEVSYEMWPFNVENFKKNLGGQLRERWKRYGVLYLEEKARRYWFAHVTSEPIELDFQKVQLQ